MNNTTDISNTVLDIMIKEAVIANFEERMNALPTEEELRKEFRPSPEHVRKMKSLFRKERWSDFTKRQLPTLKAAVVALCVATSVFFSALMFNPQVRADGKGNYCTVF